MADASRVPPEQLPPLERIGWLVAGCALEGRGGACVDCGAKPDSDGVTEHAEHCGLAAALVAYYDFRRTERDGQSSKQPQPSGFVD